jgi:choline dehydrogenase-like flavoprotein
MIFDFRSLEDGLEIETDLCIIGAGAAGITIARELAGTGINTYLIESGGLEFEPEIQALYEGEILGRPYFVPLGGCRLRYFGGSTNHWSGWCGPLNDLDFEVRPWVPHSGWPISKQDLDPFYERAQPICGLGPYVYDERVWTFFEKAAPAFDPKHVTVRFWQFGDPPVNFGEAYRKELVNSDNVRILLHANVANIQTNETSSAVDYAEIRTLTGKSGRVSAKVFVIACGAIENARVLLLSNKVEAAGLGNRHDLVGRFFMEHLDIPCGVVATKDPYYLLDKYRRHTVDGVRYMAGLCTSEETQEREQVLNSGARIDYEPDPDSGSAAARYIFRQLKKKKFPDELGDKVWKVITDLDDVAASIYRRFVEGKDIIASPKTTYLEALGEQAPNPYSRVTLSEKRDALGLNQANLEWRLTELDKRSIRVNTQAVAQEFGRLNLGRVRLMDWLLDESPDWGPDLIGGCHHMGTTRMSADPKTGVVNSDCRVHGIDNFYVAGSSVFSTGGYMNPTLTIVALALRLADHLKSRFA